MSSPYTIEHWTNKGFTEDEARIEIQKRRPSNILYWTNKGFTEDEAKQKVKEHQSLRCISNKKLKEENPQKFYEQQNTRKEYWIKRGFTEDEAKQKISERQSVFTLEKCIKKYGEENGRKRWQERQDKWQKTLKSKSPEEIDKINKKKSVLLSYIKKYGEKDGKKKWSEKCKKSSCSLKNLIEKYGKEIGTKKYYDIQERIIKNRKNLLYSKESMQIFIPLYDWLIEKGYKQTDIFLGNNELGEFKLFSCRKKNNITIKKRFFYDFTIPKLHIIIEYNGEKFHPNPNKLDNNEWKKWKNPFGMSADNQFNYQKEKIELAEAAKYNVLEIWSSTKINDNLKLCKEFIIKNENNL